MSLKSSYTFGGFIYSQFTIALCKEFLQCLRIGQFHHLCKNKRVEAFFAI